MLDGSETTWNVAMRSALESCTAGSGAGACSTAAARTAAKNIGLERFRGRRSAARFDRRLGAAQFLDLVARDEVFAVLQELRHLYPAALVRDRASRMKAASARRPDRGRDVALEDDPLAARFDARVGDGDRGQ